MGNKASYLDHIGYYFFFVACAGVSIVVWVFNWICWYNQCCCCDFLHNPVNKRLVWWTSFIFLLGILACCISGFVTTNRFGFALEGSWCSFDRFYYDSLYGQLKETSPKWEGFEKTKENLGNINTFLDKIKENKINGNSLVSDGKTTLNELYDKYQEIISTKGYEADAEKANQNLLPILYTYQKIINSVEELSKKSIILKDDNLQKLIDYFGELPTDFQILENEFLEDFYYYAKVARGWGKILTMIYFCLLCITVTFAGVSMMFYACLKRQGYLLTFMHVLWNIIRFFMFSFFFYGAAYGMCYLALQDTVAFVMFVFGEENLDLENSKSYLIGGKDYLHYCLINDDHDYKNKLNPLLTGALDDYFRGCSDLNTIFSKSKLELYITTSHEDASQAHNKIIDFAYEKIQVICKDDNFGNFTEFVKRKGGLFGFLDCSFLKSDLHMMYRTVYDLSVEARILCALSCCIGFFGAVFVYFFLLVLHHYNTEIFFDTGKSIFTGFEGYGNTKKKAINDPSYKKRKIRSEIELSSRNEEYSYKLANKNDE